MSPNMQRLLAAGYCSGDEQAQTRFVRQIAEPLARQVAKRFNCDEDIEAVALVAICNATKSFSPEHPSAVPFVNYASRIARRAAIDEQRRQARRGAARKLSFVPLSTTDCSKHYTEPSPEDEILSRIDAERLLRNLPSPEREALTMRAEGFKLREIADKTGSSIGRVHSRINAARDQLRRSGAMERKDT